MGITGLIYCGERSRVGSMASIIVAAAVLGLLIMLYDTARKIK
jgi:hypothetical protein